MSFNLCKVIIIPVLLLKLRSEAGKPFFQSHIINKQCSLVWNLGLFDSKPKDLSTQRLGHTVVSHTVPKDSKPQPPQLSWVYQKGAHCQEWRKMSRRKTNHCSLWKTHCLMGKRSLHLNICEPYGIDIIPNQCCGPEERVILLN